MLHQHAVDDAQIQLAFARQCFDGLILQHINLPFSVFVIAPCLLQGNLAHLLLSAGRQFEQVFFRDLTNLGKELSDFCLHRFDDRFNVVGALPFATVRR